MSYKTRDQAVDSWVPKDADTIIDRPDFIVYAWRGMLHILAIFKIGDSWHVSSDMSATLHQLKALLEK